MKNYEEFTGEVIGKVKAKKAERSKRIKGITAAVSCVCIVCALSLVIGHFAPWAGEGIVRGQDRGESVGEKLTTVRVSSSVSTLSAKEDYSGVYDMLTRDERSAYDKFIRFLKKIGLVAGNFDGNVKYSLEVEEVMPDADVYTNGAPRDQIVTEDVTDGAPEHTGTNVQVEGIDEADAVKTDGKYIYALSYGNVYIYEVNGGELTLASKIPLTGEDESLPHSEGADKLLYAGTKDCGMDTDIYVTDSRLIVVGTAYDMSREDAEKKTEDAEYYYRDPRRTFSYAAIYDVTDRTQPVFMHTAAMSGTLLSTRMVGNELYVVSSEFIADEGIKKSDPETFVPIMSEDGKGAAVGCDSIFCGEEKTECRYLNVFAVDTAEAVTGSTLSLLGYSGDNMYQSEGAIYATQTDWEYTVIENRAESDFKTTVYTAAEAEGYTGPVTYIAKITTGETMELAADAKIRGQIINQFSMDEYNGYFRVGVTETDQIVYPSPEKTENGSDVIYTPACNSNALLVLDGELNEVGSVHGIAWDEEIYSMRFDGDTAYMVTYRQTDPLFRIDVSDPTAPKVTGELEMPGYSSYLHKFSDGLMLGLGKADNGYIKIDMYKVSDGEELEKVASEELEGEWYSEAMTDHHAIIVDGEKGLVAFPTDNYYFVYTYGEDGFALEAKLALDIETHGEDYFDFNGDGRAWGQRTRAAFIGDYLFIASEAGINAYESEDYTMTDSEMMDTLSEEYYKIVYGWEPVYYWD